MTRFLFLILFVSSLAFSQGFFGGGGGGVADITLTTKGDLLTRDASELMRLPVGADNLCLIADSSTASGLKWDNCSGVPFSSPLTTKGDIFVYSTEDDRLAVGSNGECLKANSVTATGLEWGDCFTPTFTPTSTDTLENKTIAAGQNTISGIADSNIASEADIALSKLEGLTTNRVLQSSGAGVIEASSVTSTTLGFLDATSSIQTQLDGKLPSSGAGLLDPICFEYELPAEKVYTLRYYADFAFTINSVRGEVQDNSIDGQLRINGTPVTGCSAMEFDDVTPVNATCTAVNSVSVGDQLTLALSNNSDAEGLIGCISITR